LEYDVAVNFNSNNNLFSDEIFKLPTITGPLLLAADVADGRRDTVGLGTNRDGDGKDGSTV